MNCSLNSKKSGLVLNRIERVLTYIEENLDQPLTVESMADKSSWSRWQFQRVFSNATGLSVAQYVRELRLSRAAELLLTTRKRQLDIALSCGFDSEISFSRSFRQMFGCTPGAYRRRDLYVGIRTPIRITSGSNEYIDIDPKLLQIRLENRPGFNLLGMQCSINGLLSSAPDFIYKAPQLWMQFSHLADQQNLSPFAAIGVIDTSNYTDFDVSLPYWAGIEQPTDSETNGLSVLQVPEQEYMVIPHRGPVALLHKTLEWVIHFWLPESGYRGANGFELELYGRDYDPFSESAYMEYWLPIQRYGQA